MTHEPGSQFPLSLEHEALASVNYLTRLVEPETGFTFFDVYLTDPAEAAHDWPDFLDVPGRSAEAAALVRHITGRDVETETAFFSRIYSFQEDDGWFWRPETTVTRHEMHPEEQALVLGALLSRAIGDDDAEAQGRLTRLVDALAAWAAPVGPFGSMTLRSVVRAHEAFGSRSARSFIERVTQRLTEEQPLFRSDGTFAGHVHSHLHAAAGLAEAGRVLGCDAVVEWMDRVFRAMRDRSTDFGFIPELTERDDDVIACETCCIMDYIHLAIALTRAGHTEYFDDIERTVRNHLVESRVQHGDWLPASPDAMDDQLIRRRGVQRDVIGAYAGWSSPNHILAYDEFLPPAWLKTSDLAPIYLHKVRALQNCCSPSGAKALYLAWQHASVVEGSTLRINLLLDRALPEAEVRGGEPWEGTVSVRLDAPLTVAMRLPRGVSPKAVAAAVGDRPVPLTPRDGYVETPKLDSGVTVLFSYPLHERTESAVIGNEGYHQYEYTVRWRGSTVLSVEPGENACLGRSRLMDQPVRLYYGKEGPHPLYQRAGLLAGSPSHRHLHVSRGPGVW